MDKKYKLLIAIILTVSILLLIGFIVWLCFFRRKKGISNTYMLTKLPKPNQELINSKINDFIYIPKVIYMTYHDINSIPQYVFDNINKYCSGYEVKIYDDQKCRDFLYKYYGANAVSIFDNLSFGAHKADFWKYCILYVFGGYYFDIKTSFLKHIDQIFDNKKEKTWYTVICDKKYPKCIFNGIIVTPPRNPVLWKCMMYFYDNVNTNEYMIFVNNLYKNLQNTFIDTLKLGKNYQNNGWVCILFQENCEICTSKGKGRCGKDGRNCQIYNEKDINIIQTRYIDFPWDKSKLNSSNKIKFIDINHNGTITKKENGKTKIAIINTYNWHYECLGLLLDMMNNQYDIDFYSVPDIEGYVEYFEEKYTFKNFNINFSNIDQDKYDRIIKLTSTDPFIINNPLKLIYIHHTKPSILETLLINKPLSVIRLSKLVRCKEIYSQYYTLDSIFEANVINDRNNQILLIGGWEDGPLSSLIKNFNYNIINIRRDPRKIDRKFCKYPNIECLYSVSTKKLFELVSKSKFIFIQPKTDRFSGAIALALSFHIPMIMDHYQSTYYEFPCFTYKNNIIELENKLNNLHEAEYNNFMKDYTNYIKNSRENNRKNSNKILKLEN